MREKNKRVIITVIVFAVLAIITSLNVNLVYVSTESMMPTIRPVSLIIYCHKKCMKRWFSDMYQKRDIIIFKDPKPIQEGDLLVKRIAYMAGERIYINEYGDMVLASEEIKADNPYILPIPFSGTKVGCNDALYIHSGFYLTIINEPSYKQNCMTKDSTSSFTIEDDYYFVLGDNIDQSLDSRFFGLVKRSEIVGKAIFIIKL